MNAAQHGRRKPTVNQQHYNLLKQGIDTWNTWREEYPDVHPDFSSANFNDANLRYANLSNADLNRAYFMYADLNHAILSNANLSNAILAHAELHHTFLIGADLSNAILAHTFLIGADFRDANLSNTNFDNANFSNTTLGTAYLSHTVFAQNDLSTTKGLSEILHLDYSLIELHTVKLPQDGSALRFLRGAGVPDEWIDFYRSTMMHPIQYHSCFISYSSSDEVLAKRLHADLQDEGVRCWFAPHDMQPGQIIHECIDQAIQMQDKLLLILSEGSVKSGWVSYEVKTALNREIRQQRDILFPIRIDDAVFESTANWATSLVNQRHIGDFREWTNPKHYQQVFKRLLRDLKAQT